MKLEHIFISLCALILLAACAAKPGVTPDSLPAESGDELFSRAEKLFDARAYDEAAALYDEYFSRYADKPPAADQKLYLEEYIKPPQLDRHNRGWLHEKTT